MGGCAYQTGEWQVFAGGLNDSIAGALRRTDKPGTLSPMNEVKKKRTPSVVCDARALSPQLWSCQDAQSNSIL